MTNIDNVSMTVTLNDYAFRVTRIVLFDNGAAELHLQCLDIDDFQVTGTVPSLGVLSDGRFSLTDKDGKAHVMRRVMRAPWTYEQMTRGKPGDSLATVTKLERAAR